jgi:Tfp pilus assembly protein FimT
VLHFTFRREAMWLLILAVLLPLLAILFAIAVPALRDWLDAR